jgi:Glycosyl transferases group 1
MRLIVSELKALDHYVSREFSFIIHELIDNHAWRHMETSELADDPRPWRDLIRMRFDEMPEVILFWEGYGLINRHARQIHALDCKKFIFADDLHYRDESVRWSKLLAYLVCDVVISTYADRFEAFYPEVYNLKRVVWSPHCASPDFLLSFNEQAVNAVFLSGAINSFYPLRRLMCELSEANQHGILRQSHPGYHCGYNHVRDRSVGPGYARTVNRYRAAFTDSSIYQYTVAKFFEIPATGVLLLADAAVREPLIRLGLIEGEHYVSASPDNLADRVREVLDEANHEAVDAIRRRGQKLVWDRHTTSHRSRLINDVCRPS